MRILVTGGHGFIGSRVVERLLGEGHTIRCLVRPTSDCARIAHLQWERAEGDVRDPESLRAAIQDQEAVIHLASPSSWNDIASPAMRETVVGGTRNLLDLARQAKVRRVVSCSSTIAIGGSPFPRIHDEHSRFELDDRDLVYAHCKHEAEQLCFDAARMKLGVVVVNPAEVYGPHDTGMVTAGNLVDFARQHPVLVSNGGTSIVHVDDVANGIVRALERGRAGERYILGGDNLTIRQLSRLTLRILGKRRRIITVPTPVLRGLTWAALRVGATLPFNPNVVPYATRFWFVSNAKARRELGITFRSAEETLRPTLEWLEDVGRLS
jgi:dihydroflavonol-4-reductase